MHLPITPRRLAVVLAVTGGIALQAVPTSAMEFTCNTMSPDEAQEFLEANPAFADVLDLDGDGVACNEEDGADDSASQKDRDRDDEEDEDKDSDREDKDKDKDKDEDEDAGAADDEIVATVEDEVEAIDESFQRYLEILDEVEDASDAEAEDLYAELVDIITMWSEYPETAEEIEFPRGYDDLEESYLELAGLVGETGDAFFAWLDTEEDSPEYDEAWETYITAYDDTLAAIEDTRDALESADAGQDAVVFTAGTVRFQIAGSFYTDWNHPR